ncbi:MAG: hypothetical protein LUO97_05540 [Methanomicrobiales archaeon]|nr:hypothetical protein [Methanomicrobiales archaeon]
MTRGKAIFLLQVSALDEKASCSREPLPTLNPEWTGKISEETNYEEM